MRNKPLAYIDPDGTSDVSPARHQELFAIDPVTRPYTLPRLSELSQALNYADRAKAAASEDQDPESSGEVWSNEGIALAWLGRFSQALNPFDRAEQLPISSDVRFSTLLFRADCLERIGNLTGAMEVLDRVPDGDGSREVQYAKGMVSNKLGKTRDALRYFTRAADLPVDGRVTDAQVSQAIQMICKPHSTY